MSGSIVLAATPIGNVGDASDRLREALATADVIAAEDTRRLYSLARALGVTVTGVVVALYDHNEAARADDVVFRAVSGATVLVVSDAGMPTVSDPGYRVVAAAAAQGVRVTVLPGPSATLAALALSGLPSDRFCFEGFLPRKAGERDATLRALAAEPRTMVFFEAPHRLRASVEAAAAVLGDERPASLSREITKEYEETVRGTLGSLREWAHAHEPRGEFVLVVAGRPAEAGTLEVVVAEALERVAAGERAKEVVADLSHATGLPQRELYAAVVAARSPS
jgi:16S rRNA (cytidine1402-2'-O)-methyltransferase